MPAHQDFLIKRYFRTDLAFDNLKPRHIEAILQILISHTQCGEGIKIRVDEQHFDSVFEFLKCDLKNVLKLSIKSTEPLVNVDFEPQKIEIYIKRVSHQIEEIFKAITQVFLDVALKHPTQIVPIHHNQKLKFNIPFISAFIALHVLLIALFVEPYLFDPQLRPHLLDDLCQFIYQSGIVFEAILFPFALFFFIHLKINYDERWMRDRSWFLRSSMNMTLFDMMTSFFMVIF